VLGNVKVDMLIQKSHARTTMLLNMALIVERLELTLTSYHYTSSSGALGGARPDYTLRLIFL